MTTKAKLGRPPLPSGKKRQMIKFRLDPETVNQLRRLALRNRSTMTGIIEKLIDDRT